MTTPLTPKDVAALLATTDPRDVGLEARLIRTLSQTFATLDRERRERVDPDLRAALTAIRDMEPVPVTLPDHADCAECRDISERVRQGQWHISGMCDERYRQLSIRDRQVDSNYRAQVYRMRDIAREALAATPDHTVVGEEREAEIDVERLARAAANESDSATEDERRNGDLWSLLSERIRDDWRRKAHRIAAEYRATPRPR